MVLEYPELLSRLDEDKIVEIYSALSRRVRNMLEGQFAKKHHKGLKVSLKSGRERTATALAVREGIVKEQNGQMAEELFRTWLYGKRDMLKSALDFLGVPNEDGLTTDELTVVEKAEAAKLSELVAYLTGQGYPLIDVAIYLAFLKAENLAECPDLAQALGLK